VAMRILPESLLPRQMIRWFSCDARSRKYTCAVNRKIGVAVCVCVCVVTVCSETIQAASCCEWLECTEGQPEAWESRDKACVLWLRYVQDSEAVGGKLEAQCAGLLESEKWE
jgi:hypothetical protein